MCAATVRARRLRRVSTNSPSLRRGLLFALCVIVVALMIAWLVRDRAQPLESTQPAVVAAVRVPDELALVDAPIDARGAIDVEPFTGPVVANLAAPEKHRQSGVVRPVVGRSVLVGDVAVSATDALGAMLVEHCTVDGAYAFEDLAPGRTWLSARSPSNGRAAAAVEVFGDTHLDLRLIAQRTVEVRVVDELGKPTEQLGLLAVATAESPGEWIDEVRGSFGNPFGLGWFDRSQQLISESRSEVLGRLFLDRNPPLHVSLLRYQHVLETHRIELGTEVVEFVLRSDDERARNGGLRLRVVDAQTSEPIERVMATADGPASSMGQGRNGVCEFAGLMPGMYRLQLMSKARGTVLRDVRVPPGEIVDLGDVPMEAGSWVAGRILDETGQGLVLNVRFDPCEPDGRIGPVFSTIYGIPTKRDGSFRVSGLAPGFHRLEVMPNDGQELAESVAVFDVRDGPIENATLTVTAGVPFVVDPDGQHGPDARFAVLDEKGVRIVSRLLTEPSPVRVRLAPGRYTVVFKSSREDPDPRISSFEIVREPVVVRMR